MAERSYSHTDAGDIMALREDLASATLAQKATICCGAADAGLMIFRDMAFSAALGMAKDKLGRAPGVKAFADIITVMSPELVDDLWSETMQHMAEGRDTYDPASAGGWSGPEMEAFLVIARGSGWEAPEEAPGRKPGR